MLGGPLSVTEEEEDRFRPILGVRMLHTDVLYFSVPNPNMNNEDHLVGQLIRGRGGSPKGPPYTKIPLHSSKVG